MYTQKVSLSIIDCGQASKKTRGFPLRFFFEIGFPPFIGAFSG
jgi:hypothetical protein